ncbi:MAG: GldG family protein [Thiomargarita sp.]|nr:GldG family protein [Thiomargarita sp.]
MQVTKRTHLQARLQTLSFVSLLILIIGLLAWLSNQYQIKADWTINNRHTLSEASKKLLLELPEPIKITAYIGNNIEIRQPIEQLIELYQREANNISLDFIDPIYSPEEVRQQGIVEKGEILVSYDDRTEYLRYLTEEELTSALKRLLRPARLVMFLTGHDERSPIGMENHDLSEWTKVLKETGINVQMLNFGKQNIPAETNVLVISSARKQLLPREVESILNYIDNGGNLLWLLDPSTELDSLNPLFQELSLSVQAGIVIDPFSSLLGVDDPAVISISGAGYNNYHPITSGFTNMITLFPHASTLKVNSPEASDWEQVALLTTNPQAWLEMDDKIIEFNQGTDIEGPLDIAIALTRQIQQSISEEQDNSEIQEKAQDNKLEKELQQEVLVENDIISEINSPALEEIHDDIYTEQRILVVGEGDFISNAFIGYGGNLDLGVKMMNWLTEDDTFIDIPNKTAVDLNLDLPANMVILLGGFFLFILPIGLISIGIFIWIQRGKA